MISIKWPFISVLRRRHRARNGPMVGTSRRACDRRGRRERPIDVTVERGATASFTIYVSATGSVSCAVTAASPSTAKIHTSYSVSNAGAVSSTTFSGALNFFASGSGGGNCPITWTDPDPSTAGLQAQTVSASVTVGSSTAWAIIRSP